MMFLASGDSEECSICLEILNEPTITRCAHIFCSTCINDVMESTTGPLTPCPLCRTDIEANTLVKIPSIEEQQEKEKENQPEKIAAGLFLRLDVHLLDPPTSEVGPIDNCR